VDVRSRRIISNAIIEERRRFFRRNSLSDMAQLLPFVRDRRKYFSVFITNVLRIRLLEKVSSRRIELVIDQRLHLVYKLHGVREADMIIERGLIYPAGMNVEQPHIPDRAERMNAHTTRFLSRSCNDLAQCTLNSSFLTGSSVKACKDEQFHVLFSMLSLSNFEQPSASYWICRLQGNLRHAFGIHVLFAEFVFRMQPASSQSADDAGPRCSTQRAGPSPPHVEGNGLSGATSDGEAFAFISVAAGVVGGVPVTRARNPWAMPEASV
jgi:hypothetical protein